MWYKILATQCILTLMTMHEIGGWLEEEKRAGAQVASCFLLTAYVYAILIASDHREKHLAYVVAALA